jgi:hypothetical protein
VIIRVAKRHRYTVINNQLLEDSRMSWETKGLLCYLLSKPNDWRIQRGSLAKFGNTGERCVRRILQELKELGYLVQTRFKNAKNQFEWEHVVHEEPVSGPVDRFEPVQNESVQSAPVQNEPVQKASIILKTDPEKTDLPKTDLRKTEKKDRSRAPTVIPMDFVLSAEMKEYAMVRGVDPDEQFEAFRDWALSGGAKKLDWTATWRNWVRRVPEFKRRAAGPTRPLRPLNQMEELVERIRRRKRNEQGRDGETFDFGQGELDETIAGRGDDYDLEPDFRPVEVLPSLRRRNGFHSGRPPGGSDSGGDL